jgi:hypothetical protein
MTPDEVRIVHSETPVKEIWSRLGFFENEHNAREFLKARNENLTEKELFDIAKRIAFTMRTAREYYESAGRVSLLTTPLLIFYGMTALSKVLFAVNYTRKSPSKGHGLETPNQKDFENNFANLSTRVQKDGSFPQFHSCYSKETLYNTRFTIKELLSMVSEIKVEYETVYKEKSKAVLTKKNENGLNLIDTELEKYGDLTKDLPQYFPQIKEIVQFDTGLFLWNPQNLPVIRALSGEEYLILPVKKGDKNILLPEMSIHFLILYLLGMVSRYYPKEWGEIIEGKTSGEIYIIRKFLETTTRKFPNLILNKLWDRDFVFFSPQLDKETRLSDAELRRIYDYVEREMSRRMMGY